MLVSPTDISNTQHFHVAGVSGLVTGVTAGGHIFAFRNPSTKGLCLSRVRVRVRTVAGFTGAQEFALGLFKLTAYDANHSDGTSLGDAIESRDLPRKTSELTGANIIIATTGALTQNSSPTTATHPFAWDAFSELAAAATVHKGRLDIDWRAPDFKGWPLKTDEGFCLAPTVTLGAGGTARVEVEVDWYER